MDNSDAPTNPPNQLSIPLTKAINATTAIKLPAILATRKTAVIAPKREIIQNDEAISYTKCNASRVYYIKYSIEITLTSSIN